MINELIITTILCIQLIGCIINNNLLIKYIFYKKYFYKFIIVNNINYYEALIELKLLDNIYKKQYIKKYIKLNLIYAYYKIDKFSLVQYSINNFLIFNNNNKNIDFILYIRGIIYLLYSNNTLNIYFKIYYYYSNIENSYIALRYFYKIIFNYPNSNYCLMTIKYLVFIKINIVQHELEIIKYYFYHSAYVAVYNRIKKIIIEFPDTKITIKSFKYIEITYRKLQINTQY